VEAELFHADRQADGRTDMTKVIIAFCNFANAPKKKSINNGRVRNIQTQRKEVTDFKMLQSRSVLSAARGLHVTRDTVLRSPQRHLKFGNLF
jgi:hypothetical protein